MRETYKWETVKSKPQHGNQVSWCTAVISFLLAFILSQDGFKKYKITLYTAYKVHIVLAYVMGYRFIGLNVFISPIKNDVILPHIG